MNEQSKKSLLERISQASWKELATRARQESSKRWDYILFCSLDGRFAKADFVVDTHARPGRFFFSVEDVPSICGEMRRRFPATVAEIQNRAEQICSNRFSLLGYENLSLDGEIDWQTDLAHSKRAPLKPWFKVQYLDFDEVGDSKITWELSRHQHLVTLARAYLLTNETRYAEKLFSLWYDWQEDNPYPMGINWASSLEVAFRTLSWIWIDHLLQGSIVVPQHFSRDLAKALALNGRHIEKYLSTYFSPNTHLLGEAVALFSLGILYPGLRRANRWKEKGWEIIEQQSIQQVQNDGMHFEQSTHYHVYALDFFLHARILASRNQLHVNAGFDHVIMKMLEVLCTLSQAGPIPRFGDDDGGRLFDPSRNQAEHMLDPLWTGAGLFGRSDFKAAGKPCEEALWLLGTEGMHHVDRLPDSRGEFSAALLACGIYVMSSPTSGGRQLSIDAGALGAGRAGHGHADALSLHLSVGGREILTDPGTYSYVSADLDRNHFRGTRAHNTVQVDQLDQAEPSGPFGWQALPEVAVEAWEQGRICDLLIASRANKSPQPSVHQRTIVYVKPSFWFVRDKVNAAGTHKVDLRWHFASGVELVGEASSGSLLAHRAGENQQLWMLMCAEEGSEICIEEDYCSPSYGKLEPSSTLRISGNGCLPREFATILAPLPAAKVAAGSLTIMNCEGQPELHYYVFRASGESHYFVFNDSDYEWRTDVWRSDARLLYYCLSSDKALLSWAAYRANVLFKNNEPLFSEGRFLEWREWKSDGDPQAVEAYASKSKSDDVLLHLDSREDR